MLHGVLNMPIDLWCTDMLDQKQRHSRYLEASARITRQESEIAELKATQETVVSAIEVCKDLHKQIAELKESLTQVLQVMDCAVDVNELLQYEQDRIAKAVKLVGGW